MMARSGTGYQEFGSVQWYAAQWAVLIKSSLAAFPKFLGQYITVKSSSLLCTTECHAKATG